MTLIDFISLGLTLLCFCITILLDISKNSKKKWIGKLLILFSIGIIIFCSYSTYNRWQELHNSNANTVVKDLFIEVRNIDIELRNTTSSEYNGSLINNLKSSKLKSNSTKEKITSGIKDGLLYFKDIPKGDYTLMLTLENGASYESKIILKDYEDRWISNVFIKTKETCLSNYEIQIVDSNENYVSGAIISLSTENGTFDKKYITDSSVMYNLNVLTYEECPLFIKIEKDEKTKTYVITSHKKSGIQYLEF